MTGRVGESTTYSLVLFHRSCNICMSLSLGFRSRGFNLSGLKICGQCRGVLEYHFFVAVAATAATYRRGVVSSASVKDRSLAGVFRALPRPKESGSSNMCTRVCVYVRKGHNSCDINGISIAIWLRSYTCVQPSLQYSRLKLGRTMTHPMRTRVTEIAFVSSPNYIGSRSTNRSRNMAVPLYQTLVHAVTHA